MVDSFFTQEVAAAIKGIPLAALYQDDLINWFINNKGQFSIKSGYKVAWQMKIERRINAWAVGYRNMALYADHGKLWKLIWKMDVPPKVKSFHVEIRS